jgi:hypothetical protein
MVGTGIPEFAMPTRNRPKVPEEQMGYGFGRRTAARPRRPDRYGVAESRQSRPITILLFRCRRRKFAVASDTGDRLAGEPELLMDRRMFLARLDHPTAQMLHDAGAGGDTVGAIHG